MASSNAGAGGYTMFLDELDRVNAGRDRKDRVGRPKRYVSDEILSQLKQLSELRKRYARKLRGEAADWLPDRDFVTAMTDTARATVQLERSLRLAKESTAKAMGGLSLEQLDDVLRMSLPRLARGMSEADWRTLLSIGMGADIAEAAVTVWKQRCVERQPDTSSKTAAADDGSADDGKADK